MQCLASLRQVYAPNGTQLVIVVVDNEASQTIRAIVNSFTPGDYQTPILYVGEGRRGIAQARNAILAVAETQDAKWIAMVDDDMVVRADWLAHMWSSAKMGADVIQCSVNRELPEPLPKWAFPEPKDGHKWAFRRKHAQTCGVMFKAGLIDRQGVRLRFNESYALTGGEDRDFFRRAAMAGYSIIKTPDAVATEIVPASKLTFRAQVFAAFWAEAVNTQQDRMLNGFAMTLAPRMFKFWRVFLGSLLNYGASPIAALHDRQRARRRVLKATKQMGKASGIFVGMLGLARSQPYLITHGE
jgi:GT2 family glycosyltransferase